MIRHPTEKLILKSGFWMFLVKILLVFSWFLRLIFSELNNIGTNWIFFSPLCTIPPNGNSNLVFLTSNLLQQWQHKLFDLTGNHFWSFWSLAALSRGVRHNLQTPHKECVWRRSQSSQLCSYEVKPIASWWMARRFKLIVRLRSFVNFPFFNQPAAFAELQNVQKFKICTYIG